MSRSSMRSSCSTTLHLLLVLICVAAVPGAVRAQTDDSKPTAEIAALLSQASQARAAMKSDEYVRLLNDALQKSRVKGDAAGEAYALAFQGIQNSTPAQFNTAISQLQKALAFFQKHQIKQMQIIILVQMAQNCSQNQQPDRTLEYAQQAIGLSDTPEFAQFKSHALHLKTTALVQKGDTYVQREQWMQAGESYELALPEVEKTGNKDLISLISGTLSITCLQSGQYLKAMEYSQKTLQAREGVTNRAGEALALTTLAALYVDLGRYAQSRDVARQAQDLWRALGLTEPMTTMQLLLGEAYRQQEQPQTALTYFSQALPLLRKSNDRNGLAGCLMGFGGAYRSLRQPARSLPYYAEAARLYHSQSDSEKEGEVLDSQGEVCQAIGQKPLARKYFQQAQTVLNRALTSEGVVGNIRSEVATLYYIAIAEEELGQLAQAKTHLAQAVTRAEQFRASLGGLSDLKLGFFERILFGFHRNVALLMKLKQPAEAFAGVQKTKARALLDLMGGKVNITGSLTDEQAGREQELRQAADKLNAAMVQEGVRNEVGSKKRFAALKEQLTQAERSLQLYEDGLYALHPELADKRAAATITLAQTAQFLPDDTVLLEFATLYAKEYPDETGTDQTLLFVVTKQNGAAHLRVVPIAVTRAALSQQVEAFRAACADPRKNYQVEARKLYDLLIRPALSPLEGKKRLLICPDGPLWGLPFAALHDGSGFLLQKYELAYAYSATGAQAALRERPHNAPRKTLLAMGNPDFGGASRFGDAANIPGQRPIDAPSRPIDAPSRPIDAPSRALLLTRGGHITMLPGTQREVDMLHKAIPDAAIYTGAAAQEAIVKQTAGEYRYVHIASHAFFNDASPLLSSIVLAQPVPGSKDDGFLTARELFDMNLQADMVVLSACNTAQGDKRSGEGIIGLTWALFVAGTPTQVVSQWAVDDASTATLMGDFYSHLAQGKGAALRAAELTLLNDGKHAHPYYWAPFILMGDWRK